MTETASEVRCELQRYVRREVSLNTFVEWFTEALWRLHEQQDESADDLAYEIELRLDEFSSGHWTEAELRNLLRPLATTYLIRINPPQLILKTGTSSTTANRGHSVSFGVPQFAGTARGMAHA